MQGLWPGVAGIVADADIHCVECAKSIYGDEVIDAVVWGYDGWETLTDDEGNTFGVILNESEDAADSNCGDCGEPLEEIW